MVLWDTLLTSFSQLECQLKSRLICPSLNVSNNHALYFSIAVVQQIFLRRSRIFRNRFFLVFDASFREKNNFHRRFSHSNHSALWNWGRWACWIWEYLFPVGRRISSSHFYFCLVSNSSPYASVEGLFSVFFNSDISVGPVTYSLVAELSSTRLRTKTVVLARAAYNVFGLVNGKRSFHSSTITLRY